jgi:hypothetical protein
MNYLTIYDRLIDRARTRIIEGYTERHHIVPRCMGGGDEPENIVRLTPEEHFLAHQLLVKIHPDCHLLVFAVNAMTIGTKVTIRNNKQFGWIRRRFAEEVRKMKLGKPRSPEVRAKLSEANKGRPLSLETRAKMSASRKGKKHSAAHAAAISAGLKGNMPNTKNIANFKAMLAGRTLEEISASAKKSWETRRNSGKPHPLLGRKMSEEHKAKIGAAGRGRTFTQETRDKMRLKAILRETRRREARNLKHDTERPTVG